MHRAHFPLAISILTTMIFTSCSGSSSNRQLVSIAISPDPAAAKNGTVQLVATGTFSTVPVTVTPLAVDWSQSTCDNLCEVAPATATPAVIGPITVSTAGLASCSQGYSGTAAVRAAAPKDPSLPPDTQNVPLVIGTGSIVCP